MKKSPLILLLPTIVLFACSGASQLLIPAILRRSPALKVDSSQSPLMSATQPSFEEDDSAPVSGELLISDTINKRAIQIFAGLTRDIESVSTRLDDARQNSTVLAPLNSELKKLSHKPWEDPRDYGSLGQDAYEGQGGMARAQGNMRRFIEAHIVPKSPWSEGDRVQTIGGRQVWWEDKDGKRLIQPDGVEVENIPSKVSNGEVWAIKGVLNSA